jgi:hypothetical protein
MVKFNFIIERNINKIIYISRFFYFKKNIEKIIENQLLQSFILSYILNEKILLKKAEKNEKNIENILNWILNIFLKRKFDFYEKELNENQIFFTIYLIFYSLKYDIKISIEINNKNNFKRKIFILNYDNNIWYSKNIIFKL